MAVLVNIFGSINTKTQKLHLIDMKTSKILCGTPVQHQYIIDPNSIIDKKMMCKKCKNLLDKYGKRWVQI